MNAIQKRANALMAPILAALESGADRSVYYQVAEATGYTRSKARWRLRQAAVDGLAEQSEVWRKDRNALVAVWHITDAGRQFLAARG